MDVDADQLLGEGLHEEREDHRPDVHEDLVERDLGETKDEDADCKEYKYQQSSMSSFWFLDDIGYLQQERLQLRSILILLPRVEYKTNPLKTLNSLLILNRLTGEVTAREADFIKILIIRLTILIHRYDPIYDLGPVVQSVDVADEEVIFVENMQHLGFEVFDEEDPGAV